jgi:hypothetical protein
MMKKWLLLTLLTAATTPVLAASWHGETEGVFNHPQGSRKMLTEGVETDTFTWGKALPGSTVSSLHFEGRRFALEQNQTFVLGTLTYHNGANWRGTEARSVDLDIRLKDKTPSSRDNEFELDLDLVSTPNFGGPQKAADIVDFGAGKLERQFLLDGENYWLSLVGLDDARGDGFLKDNSFRVLERGTGSVDLIGKIRASASEVPVPAGLWLLASGLPVLLKNRKKRPGYQ